MSISTTEQLVHLGLGSNLENPTCQLQEGLRAIEKNLPLRAFRCAPFYLSPPMGGKEQPDYLNTVCSFFTSMNESDLLVALRKIEDQQGRQRLEHWGSRTLDIDILLYGSKLNESEELTLPHPGIELRDFVLVPLLDLSPDLRSPKTGLLYRECLEALLKGSSPSLKKHHEGY